MGLPPISEKKFMAQVLQYAKLTGWLAYHTHDSRRSAAGFPDFVLVRGGRLLFVELKTDVGLISQGQGLWIARLEKAGQDVRVWRPRDWPTIEVALA